MEKVSKFFNKHETLICMFCIVMYVVINSFCIQNFGMMDYRSVLINTAISIVLIVLILLLKRSSYYGFSKVNGIRKYLYFFPLFIIATVNIWGGVAVKNSALEIFLYILFMFNAGFIEEVLFRGFLYKLMSKKHPKIAILVSALTFGMGHIVNLINGEEFVPTMLQLCYATAIGWLFVEIFIKSKSIVPCIITHCVLNALSIFNVDNEIMNYVASFLLIIISVSYALFVKRIKIKLE